MNGFFYYLLNTHTVSVTQKGNLKNEWREKPFTEQTHYPAEVASALLLTFLHIYSIGIIHSLLSSFFFAMCFISFSSVLFFLFLNYFKSPFGGGGGLT